MIEYTKGYVEMVNSIIERYNGNHSMNFLEELKRSIHFKGIHTLMEKYERNPNEEVLEKMKARANLASEVGFECDVTMGFLDNLIDATVKKD